MSKLFDRDGASPEMDRILDSMKNSGDPAFCAIACNFRHDPRVSPDRQRRFESDMPSGLDIVSFGEFIKRRHEEKIQTPHSDDTEFLHGTNRQNWMYGGATVTPMIPGHLKLVTCLDLTGLHEVFLAAATRYSIPYFVDLLDPYPTLVTEDSSDVYGWHRKRVEGRSPAGRKQHVAELLAALSHHIAQGHHYNPTWCTFWEPYRLRIRNVKPNAWHALMGVRRCFRENRWLVLLSYSVEEVGTLVRPTVLDAGWYPLHFPSPPSAPPQNGGHPVNLEEPGHNELLCEFIHQQIPFDETHFIQIGNTVANYANGGIPLGDARTGHHEALGAKTNYGDAVAAWMRDPN